MSDLRRFIWRPTKVESVYKMLMTLSALTPDPELKQILKNAAKQFFEEFTENAYNNINCTELDCHESLTLEGFVVAQNDDVEITEWLLKNVYPHLKKVEQILPDSEILKMLYDFMFPED